MSIPSAARLSSLLEDAREWRAAAAKLLVPSTPHNPADEAAGGDSVWLQAGYAGESMANEEDEGEVIGVVLCLPASVPVSSGTQQQQQQQAMEVDAWHAVGAEACVSTCTDDGAAQADSMAPRGEGTEEATGGAGAFDALSAPAPPASPAEAAAAVDAATAAGLKASQAPLCLPVGECEAQLADVSAHVSKGLSLGLHLPEMAALQRKATWLAWEVEAERALGGAGNGEGEGEGKAREEREREGAGEEGAGTEKRCRGEKREEGHSKLPASTNSGPPRYFTASR